MSSLATDNTPQVPPNNNDSAVPYKPGAAKTNAQFPTVGGQLKNLRLVDTGWGQNQMEDWGEIWYEFSGSLMLRDEEIFDWRVEDGPHGNYGDTETEYRIIVPAQTARWKQRTSKDADDFEEPNDIQIQDCVIHYKTPNAPEGEYPLDWTRAEIPSLDQNTIDFFADSQMSYSAGNDRYLTQIVPEVPPLNPPLPLASELVKLRF